MAGMMPALHGDWSPVSSLTQRTQRNRLRLAGNRKVCKKRNKRKKITQSKTLRKTMQVSIQTQRTQPPANRNGRSKEPIIKAANQMLALFAVFVYATHATQSVALRALRALR